MNIHTNRTAKNKTEPVANYVSKQSGRTASQLVDNRPKTIAQRKVQDAISNRSTVNNVAPIQKKENNTGLPDNLKSGIENLSGHSMDDVKVHYNSDKPSQLQAHAYAQGTDIHLAAGQEKHLPHEAWHVVQQKQGRVKPTIQLKGKVNINDDKGLEKEADTMGAKAMQLKPVGTLTIVSSQPIHSPVIQQQKGNWGWARKLGGLAGAAGGAALGALKRGTTGIIEGYQDSGKGFGKTAKAMLIGGASGAWDGIKEGGYEGYERPGATLGGLATGVIAGAALGASLPAVVGVAGVAAGGSYIGNVLNKQKNPFKTKITHTVGHITIDEFTAGKKTNHEVGKKMVARLSANDPVTGSATDVNWTWMQFIRNKCKAANVVRGHLLNHDLGGYGMPANLYPISTQANQDHSTRVEQPVKTLLKEELNKDSTRHDVKYVNYTVEVREAQTNEPWAADFICDFHTDDGPRHHVTIPSVIYSEDSHAPADRGGFGGGKKDAPLANTKWSHRNRKGHEKGDEKSSLAGHLKERSIVIEGEDASGFEGNLNAQSRGGEGARKANEALIFEELDRRVFDRYPRGTKSAILVNLGFKPKDRFMQKVLEAVRASASYGDNKYESESLNALILKIVEDHRP